MPAENQDSYASDLALAVIIFALIAASLAGVTWLLGVRTTDRSLILMGGASGAATALIALVLRAAEPLSGSKAIRTRRVAALLSYPAGFLAGAFSVLAAVALLGVAAQRASMSGAAMIGGLYGLLLGAYWAKAIETAATRDTLLAPTVTAVENRFLPSARTNWSGKVLASARRVEGEIIAGEVTVWFEPQAGRRRKGSAPAQTPQASPAPGTSGESPAEVSSTSLVIQDGKDGTHAEFLITISGGEEMPVFPRRQIARVPTDAISENYIFKLLAPGEARPDGDGELSMVTAPSKEPMPVPMENLVSAIDASSAARPSSRPILVDISMAGRTVQVIETRLD